ncbi:CCNB1 [Lepeophtheirus salmonis]|uniref:CCNB1 n=1 Tax=Lepeophtheirus salmonis TaxID=72036 RepID=A0A7R8CL75_LEPSM|nr:CCNB1 [Lepeophtheirus salmonis]CAF2853149.1 CCNB1 [Lepeophtheirus salmonis]
MGSCHQQFSLLQETLYLTVCINDYYLQEEGGNTQKKILQLVGVPAIFFASKYKEMSYSEVCDFVFITDNMYTEHQIRTMEIKRPLTLNFELGRPLPFTSYAVVVKPAF